MGLTIMYTAGLVTLAGDAHAAFEVIVTVTLSELSNAEEVKPAPVPRPTPFTFQL